MGSLRKLRINKNLLWDGNKETFISWFGSLDGHYFEEFWTLPSVRFIKVQTIGDSGLGIFSRDWFEEYISLTEKEASKMII